MDGARSRPAPTELDALHACWRASGSILPMRFSLLSLVLLTTGVAGSDAAPSRPGCRSACQGACRSWILNASAEKGSASSGMRATMMVSSFGAHAVAL